MKTRYVSRFTPSLMKPEDLEAIFVQREDLARRILELIRESVLTRSKHYTLLIAPRGIGKTHLAAIVYHRVRAMEDLRDKLLIAWLREEEWGVMSFLDFLLRIFRALAEEDDELAERVETVYGLPSDQAEGTAAALLKDFVAQRTLFVIVENLDDLFDGLGDEGQKRLRAYLQENPFCTILATAQSLFNGISLQTSPFYGFFRIQHLQELSFDQGRELLRKIASFRGDSELASFMETPKGRARVRALHHLAGGNHRVYVIFSEFVTRGSLDKLVDPVLKTLDDLTPYYQARMARLSPQQRKIVEFLCDRRGAVPVKELASRCFMSQQTASGQLRTLREMGYVRSDAVGRESYYELREILMRLCMEVKNHRGQPVRLFVEFLRLWYSRAELDQRLRLLPPSTGVERECLLEAMRAAEGESQDPRIMSSESALASYLKDHDLSHALQAAEELASLRGRGRDWAMQGILLGLLGRCEEALACTEQATELDPEAGYWWLGKGIALGNLGRYEEALSCLERAAGLAPTIDLVWLFLGILQSLLGRPEEALSSYERAVELDPRLALAWSARGEALLGLERYEEALDSIKSAKQLGLTIPGLHFRLARCLVALRRWDEALAALDIALGRFGDAKESDLSHTVLLVRNVLASTVDEGTLAARVRSLVVLYARHKILSALALGVVANIPTLRSPIIGEGRARAWRDIWRREAADREDLRLAARLLDAAVRYRESEDPRILLELPAEERKLLQELLDVGKADEDSE